VTMCFSCIRTRADIADLWASVGMMRPKSASDLTLTVSMTGVRHFFEELTGVVVLRKVLTDAMMNAMLVYNLWLEHPVAYVNEQYMLCEVHDNMQHAVRCGCELWSKRGQCSHEAFVRWLEADPQAPRSFALHSSSAYVV
jgi:hypothetical protein